MLLIPTEICKNHPQPPPTLQNVHKSKNHGFDKSIRIRIHHGLYLNTDKRKHEIIPIPVF